MRKDFCLCFNDAYTSYASVTIKSIMDNAKSDDEIVIHVFSDYLSDPSRNFLSLYNVEFHLIESDKVFDGIDTSVWSVYTLYRLFLPKYLNKDIHKVLYLDCDVIVNDSLDELFEMDMKGKAIAGCIDPQTYNKEAFARLGYGYHKKYICAGVLLMNIDYWRDFDLSTRVIDYMKSNSDKIAFLEQDALNYLCCDNKIILPARYGVQVSFFLHENFLCEHISEMQELIVSPAIIHYAGYQPWVYCKNKSIHSDLWWNTYKSLHAFPSVITGYYSSIIKYVVRYLLSVCHVIQHNNKYHIDQYYNHPRIRKKNVEKRLMIINSSESSPK